MALQVWLPLLGNLNNQGLDNNAAITGGGSTYNNNGKIGKCYADNTAIVVKTSTVKDKRIWSFCFWGYVVSANVTSNWTRIAAFNDGSSWFRVEVCPQSYANGVYCYSCHNNTDYNITSGALGTPAGGYYDQWAHFCVTSDGTTITKYMNGTKIATATYEGTGTPTGEFTLNYSSAIYKNDFRIYDHCLSAKEVAEIAKGLVLHYRLSGPGGENLLPGTGLVKRNNVAFSYDSSTATYTTTTPSEQTYYGVCIATENCQIPWNYIGILSMEIYSPVATTFLIDDNDFALDNSLNGNDNTTRGTISKESIPANTWTKIIRYSINNLSKNTNHTTIKVMSSFNIKATDTEFQIRHIKFEIFSDNTIRMATPWCPNAADSLFSALGYNNNIEYDCSGYNNNGTIINKAGYNYITSGSNLLNIAQPTGLERMNCNNVTSVTATSSGLHLITPEDSGNANNGIIFTWSNFRSAGLNYGDTITFSADIKGTTDTNIPMIAIHAHNTTSDYSYWYASGNKNKYANMPNISSTTWQRYSVTMTLPTKTTENISICGFAIHGNMGADLYIRNLKVEVGTVATPYSTGINNAKLWDVDSPKYTTSYNFPGGSFIKLTNPYPIGAKVANFTHTAWIKWNKNCYTNNGIHSLAGGNSFFRLSLGKNNMVWSYGMGCSADGTTQQQFVPINYGAVTDLVDGQWYFIACVFDQGKTTLYIDGKLVASSDKSSSYASLINQTNTLYVAAQGNYSEIAVGNIADTRFYATSLSADAVAELYHSAVIVDNTGKSYAYEYYEG